MRKFCVFLFSLMIFITGCGDAVEKSYCPFDSYEDYYVMTGKMKEELRNKVFCDEQREHILNAFNENKTDLKDEYKVALSIGANITSIDKVYYGHPICIYYLLLLPKDEPLMEKQWIVPVFIDNYDRSLLGYYSVYESSYIDGDFDPIWTSANDDLVYYDSLFFDFDNVSHIFSGSNPNIYICTQKGFLLCNEKGWFPLFEENQSPSGDINGYTSAEATGFVTQNSYAEIIEILENDFGEELESVNIRDKYETFIN